MAGTIISASKQSLKQQAFNKGAAAFRVSRLCVDFTLSRLESLAASSILLPGLNWRLLPAGHVPSHLAAVDIGLSSCLDMAKLRRLGVADSSPGPGYPSRSPTILRVG